MQDCKVRISSVGTAAVAYHSSYREKQGNRQTAAGTTSPIFKAYQRQNSGDCSPLSNNYSKLIELNHRMREVSRVVRTESTRSFKISAGTGMSTNWRFLRLNRSRVTNRQKNSYKSFINTRIGPIYDGFRADSLLKSYNFSEALETDPNGNITTTNGSSFSILEQTKRFEVSREIAKKPGVDVKHRLLQIVCELSSVTEQVMYEKIDCTIRRTQ